MASKIDIPVLEGYTSLPRAAEVLAVSRQRIFQMAQEEGKFRTVCSVPGASETRPAAYVVQNIEILVLRMAQCEECSAATQAGGDVLYCTHAGLDVPGWQVAAWKKDHAPAVAA